MDTRLFLSRSGHPIYTFTTKSLTFSQNKIDLVFLADSLTEDFYNLIANKIDILVEYDSAMFYQTNGSVATFVIDNTETLDDGTVSVTAHILIGDMKDEINTYLPIKWGSAAAGKWNVSGSGQAIKWGGVSGDQARKP